MYRLLLVQQTYRLRESKDVQLRGFPLKIKPSGCIKNLVSKFDFQAGLRCVKPNSIHAQRFLIFCSS